MMSFPELGGGTHREIKALAYLEAVYMEELAGDRRKGLGCWYRVRFWKLILYGAQRLVKIPLCLLMLLID